MQHTNEIEIETQDDIAILEIRGDITALSEPFLNEAYQKADNQGARKILLKIDQVPYINSSGIAVLIQILAQTKRKKQLIGITGISEHFKKIFNMMGITKFARIYDSVEEAMDMMARESA